MMPDQAGDRHGSRDRFEVARQGFAWFMGEGWCMGRSSELAGTHPRQDGADNGLPHLDRSVLAAALGDAVDVEGRATNFGCRITPSPVDCLTNPLKVVRQSVELPTPLQLLLGHGLPPG